MAESFKPGVQAIVTIAEVMGCCLDSLFNGILISLLAPGILWSTK
jgi:hypothetical protein